MPVAPIQTEDEIIAWLNARGNGDPDENGISLDQLRENRKLTPTERLLKLENAVGSLWELRRLCAVAPSDDLVPEGASAIRGEEEES